MTLWTVAYQAPLSMGFSRQEYWSGFPFPSPGDLPDPGIEPGSSALTGRFFTICHPYANAEFIINETEKKCLERLNQKDANKQKKSDLKKAMSQYHKEIKKIAAAHLNKNYEPSSMKDYQEALDKARSACKKGSPDIEIIMEELRKAVQNLRVLT